MHIIKNHYATILIFITGIFLFCSTNQQTTGTVDDSDTGITVFLPDSSPAIDAVVKFIPSTRSQTPGLLKRFSAPSAVAVVRTDSKGKFQVPALADSTYNIFMEKGNLKAFQGEVVITSQGNTIQNDTLQKTGSFSAVIGLDPKDMHNVGSVAIQILGSDVQYINPDKKGSFIFKDIAAGDYKLRLETNLPEYSPTFFTMTIKSNIDSIYPDTIYMKYTGIPSVLGLSAAFDTSSGIVHLSWHPAEYSNVLDYVIFRDAEPTVAYSGTPYKATSDTSIVDTVFNIRKTPIDSQSHSFKYRVAIRNNSTIIGNTYGAISVTATPYKSVLPKIDSIKVAFDTTSGTARISWVSIPVIDSNYDYFLIRTIKHSASGWPEELQTSIATDTLGHVSSSPYTDSLYGKKLSFNDNATWNISYTVSVFKKEWKLSGGETPSTPLLISPYKARIPQTTRTTIAFDTLHGVASVSWDSIPAATGVSGYRVIRTLSRQLQPPKVDTLPLKAGNTLLDTIYPKYVLFDQTDPVEISYAVSAHHAAWGIYGMETVTTDTVYSYKAFPPEISAGPDQTVDFSSEVLLVGQVTNATFPVAKKEWKIGDGAWVSTGDSVQFTTNGEYYREIISCIFRVTDSMGNVAVDTVAVTKTMLVVTLGTLPTSIQGTITARLSTTNEFLYFGCINYEEYNVWYTPDFKNYTLLSSNFSKTTGGRILTFKNNYYIYNIPLNDTLKCYKSSDAISWSEIKLSIILDTSILQPSTTDLIPIKDNIIVIISSDQVFINHNWFCENTLYKTNDGIFWDSVKSNLPREPLRALFKIGDTLCLVTNKGKKYSSPDGGITWNADKLWDSDEDRYPDKFYYAYSDSITIVAYEEYPSDSFKIAMFKNGIWKILPSDLSNSIGHFSTDDISIIGNRCYGYKQAIGSSDILVRSIKLY